MKIADLGAYRKRAADARRLAGFAVDEASRLRHLNRARRYDRLIDFVVPRMAVAANLSPHTVLRIESLMSLTTQFFSKIELGTLRTQG